MLGSNVPTTGGLPKGFVTADQWGCECIQVYITPSRKWDVPDLSFDEIQKFKIAQNNSSVKHVVAHIPFLVNLASPESEKRQKSIKRLSIELERAKQLGVPSLVLHPGSYISSSEQIGLQCIIDGLKLSLDKSANLNTVVYLETTAGQGSNLGYKFEQIAYILKGVDRAQLGVCFDTCHVFAAGYDIRGYEGYKNVLNVFDKVIGLDKLGVIHLNDSSRVLGSRIDRHATIGKGYIGEELFKAIVNDSRFQLIPKILEEPDRDTNTPSALAFLRQLQKDNY
jgi:deoxyribonuclease-4